MNFKNNLFKLSGKIRHYPWGGHHFLPALLGLPNPKDKPFAEYWIGAHDTAPSDIHIVAGHQMPLNQYFQQHPDSLGKWVYQKFKGVPFLLKVLDVKDMLSIQVHPSKEAAAIGFEKENEAGISLKAANRNYKDDNHKPELMVALSEFWLLHGFKSPDKIIEQINSIPAFAFMLPLFKEGGYKKLYSTIMEMEQKEVNRILAPLMEKILPAYEAEYLPKGSTHYWAARAALLFNTERKLDRGIFSIYLLNLLHLNKGEAIFQDAGVLHAYLEGQNIEIMASSDNVLRGGLTEKHIDVPELLKQVKFEGISPAVLHPKVKDYEETFESPVRDFCLSRFVFKRDGREVFHAFNIEIVLVMEGEVEFKEGQHDPILLKQGQAAIVFADTTLRAQTMGPAVFYRAKVNI